MCPTDRINPSEAPHCLVQHAICPKLDPKLHMAAAACKGLRQTMSDTMGLAVPLAERLSCQPFKKPHVRRRQEVWLWREFILSDRFAWMPFTSPRFSYIIIHLWKKACSRGSCRGQWCRLACSNRGTQHGRGWVTHFFLEGGSFSRNALLYK